MKITSYQKKNTKNNNKNVYSNKKIPKSIEDEKNKQKIYI